MSRPCRLSHTVLDSRSLPANVVHGMPALAEQTLGLLGLLLALLAVAVGLGWLGLRLASWRSLSIPAKTLAWLVGGVLGVRRAHVVSSLHTAGIGSPERVARGMYQGLGRGLLELLWVALRPARPLDDLVELDSRVLEELLASGRGVVVATAHTGNWDLVACAAAQRVPLTVATKRLKISWLDRLWQGTRARRGVSLVEAGSIARSAAQALGRGQVVAMLVDQAPERTRATVACLFLGQTALVDLAPALIAMRARVPLLAVFARRRADGTHLAEIAAVLEPPARPSRAWAEQAMVEVTELLERFVRCHPEQWLWMHRRWKGVERADAPGANASGHGSRASKLAARAS